MAALVLVPLNAAMMLSIPVEGTHYLTDMLMGLIVALVAISLARACTELFARRAPLAY
jgi:membrane-associated phospholipid phosphatase